MFAVRNQMSLTYDKFSSKQEIEVGFCWERVTMEHTYSCKENSEPIEVSYNQLLNGSIHQQIIVYKIFQKMAKREKNMKNENEKEKMKQIDRDWVSLNCRDCIVKLPTSEKLTTCIFFR